MPPRILVLAAAWLSLFPFVSLGIIDSDTQPYAVLMAGVVVLLSLLVYSFDWRLWLLAVPAAFCVILSFDPAVDAKEVVRSTIIYGSPFVFSLFYVVCARKNVDLGLLCRTAFVIYTAAAAVQLVLGKEVLDFLIATRSTEQRGVTSLTPETSMYGLVSILLFCGIWLTEKSRRLSPVWVVLLCVQVLIFSRSFLALGVLGLSALISLSLTGRLRAALLGIGAFALGWYVMITLLPEGARVVDLTHLILRGPEALLLADPSGSERIFHIYLSFREAIGAFFAPHGLASFRPVIDRALVEIPLFWYEGGGYKIMSGYGAALFELGVFGLVYVFVSCAVLYEADLPKRKKVFVTCAMLGCFLNSINLAAPLFGLLVATLAQLRAARGRESQASERHALRTAGLSISNSH